MGFTLAHLYRVRRAFVGISSRYLNRVKIDVLLTEAASSWSLVGAYCLISASSKGRRFQSVRCTGPQRLVIEGDVPGVSVAGSYRFELVLDDAQEWARALEPLVEPNGDALRFGQLPVSGEK